MQEDYQQPDFYHFSRDSITLAKFLIKECSLDETSELLEIGAGCGVVTCEFLKHAKSIPKSVTLIELQEAFVPYLEKNLNSSFEGEKEKFKIINQNVFDWFKSDALNPCLIYFNPPYFFKEDSRPSESTLKDTCRRISKDDFRKLLLSSKEILKPGGEVVFCHRRQDLEEVLNLDFSMKKYSSPANDDGCCLYRFSKN